MRRPMATIAILGTMLATGCSVIVGFGDVPFALTDGGAGSGGSPGTGTSGKGGASGQARDAGTATDGYTGASGGAGSAMDASAGEATLCNAGDCTSVIGTLDGFVYTYDCHTLDSGDNGHCYLDSSCVPGNHAIDDTFNLVGAASNQQKIYLVTLRIRGILECKDYAGGQRSVSGSDTNLFFRGGLATVGPASLHALHVTPPVPLEANDYFLNSCSSDGQQDMHTFVVDYTETIKAYGGGAITYQFLDSDCHVLQNCGPDAVTIACLAPRTVSLAGAVPPQMVDQPLRSNMGYGQFITIDVLNVAPAP